ncbi:hypothetical protein IVA95_00910 [Bradyrhizobium sp. 157]|uniref:hypothetical protein n=1 Tax=Bradyrhizobium sp. 157 TaxID=2782631 RepID=UPI001FF9626C|nr:hypothetical protein [Bradyrhizobium sp. 157]MCK1636177.1 hypothetical protein [Bradyrhizobium sp. 157]
MKKLAIVFAVGAAALIGGSAANAADNAVKAKPSTDVVQSSTDFSAHRRHWRHRHWGYHRHYHRPYRESYGYYAPRRYGHYGPRYYGGGPGVTFSFGTGGYRW